MTVTARPAQPPAGGGAGAAPAPSPTPAPGPPAPRLGPWRRTPLWLRLITALLVLSALGVLLAGMSGARLLRSYLVGRVDDELRAAVEPYTVGSQLDGGATGDLPSEFSIALQDAQGRTRATLYQPLYDNQSPPDYPRLTPVEAAAHNGEPFTVPAVDHEATWRVLARPLADRSGTLLVAESLDDVESTVNRLVRIDLIAGALVLAGLAVVGYSMVRAALHPLTKIEETAAAIAGGDLSRRIADQDRHTEVGRLGAALNGMLNQIESAFHAREASEARARRSEERMRQFVADASHELRTPLTTIRGFAELHRQGAVTDPAEVAGLLERIEAEATRMGLLVDDLLLLARLDTQRPLQKQAVDLVVVAGDTVATARARAPEREIRLVVDDADNPDEASLEVPGDEARLRQVATNLVDNALTHTPEGTPVTVRLASVSRNGQRMAVLEVSDRGPGLTPEQAERVFERFYRTDRARSRVQGGTGLGLSIVAAITALHGGTVEVDSTPGAGATFRVLLPAMASDPVGGG